MVDTTGSADIGHGNSEIVRLMRKWAEINRIDGNEAGQKHHDTAARTDVMAGSEHETERRRYR